MHAKIIFKNLVKYVIAKTKWCILGGGTQCMCVCAYVCTHVR